MGDQKNGCRVGRPRGLLQMPVTVCLTRALADRANQPKGDVAIDEVAAFIIPE
jgi:hypothetical protein